MQLLKKLRGEEKNQNVISFSNKDLIEVYNFNNDLIIVSMTIANPPIRRILMIVKVQQMCFFMTFLFE